MSEPCRVRARRVAQDLIEARRHDFGRDSGRVQLLLVLSKGQRMGARVSTRLKREGGEQLRPRRFSRRPAPDERRALAYSDGPRIDEARAAVMRWPVRLVLGVPSMPPQGHCRAARRAPTSTRADPVAARMYRGTDDDARPIAAVAARRASARERGHQERVANSQQAAAGGLQKVTERCQAINGSRPAGREGHLRRRLAVQRGIKIYQIWPR